MSTENKNIVDNLSIGGWHRFLKSNLVTITAIRVEFAHFVSYHLACYPNHNINSNPNPKLGRLFRIMCKLYLFSQTATPFLPAFIIRLNLRALQLHCRSKGEEMFVCPHPFYLWQLTGMVGRFFSLISIFIFIFPVNLCFRCEQNSSKTGKHKYNM